jgi:hypothetical protein
VVLVRLNPPSGKEGDRLGIHGIDQCAIALLNYLAGVAICFIVNSSRLYAGNLGEADTESGALGRNLPYPFPFNFRKILRK